MSRPSSRNVVVLVPSTKKETRFVTYALTYIIPIRQPLPHHIIISTKQNMLHLYILLTWARNYAQTAARWTEKPAFVALSAVPLLTNLGRATTTTGGGAVARPFFGETPKDFPKKNKKKKDTIDRATIRKSRAHTVGRRRHNSIRDDIQLI